MRAVTRRLTTLFLKFIFNYTTSGEYKFSALQLLQLPKIPDCKHVLLSISGRRFLC